MSLLRTGCVLCRARPNIFLLFALLFIFEVLFLAVVGNSKGGDDEGLLIPYFVVTQPYCIVVFFAMSAPFVRSRRCYRLVQCILAGVFAASHMWLLPELLRDRRYGAHLELQNVLWDAAFVTYIALVVVAVFAFEAFRVQDMRKP